MAHLSIMPSHDEILEELKRQYVLKKFKQVDVARHLGITAPRVSEILKGNRRIQPTEMQPLADFLEMEGASDRVQQFQLPILGRVAAGMWLEQGMAKGEFEDFVVYDRLPGDVGHEGLFGLIPEGDSMNAIFSPNMILICLHTYEGFEEIEAGKYVIVQRENHDMVELTCKRLEVAENGDFLLYSESTNPDFSEPIRVPRSTENEHVDTGITVVAIVKRAVLNV